MMLTTTLVMIMISSMVPVRPTAEAPAEGRVKAESLPAPVPQENGDPVIVDRVARCRPVR